METATVGLPLLVLLLPTVGWPQSSPSVTPHGPYSLTIFADPGANASSVSQQASSGGLNMGHVFIGLTNGARKVYLGYYGDSTNPARGQLRVDADLVDSGWLYKKTYQITEQGYRAAHEMIDTWGAGNQRVGALGESVFDTFLNALNPLPVPISLPSGTWRPWCNCSDFAQAVATAAGVELSDIPEELGLNTPRSWGRYLSEHGGTTNPRRTAREASQQEQVRRETPAPNPVPLSKEAQNKKCSDTGDGCRSGCMGRAAPSGGAAYLAYLQAQSDCLAKCNASQDSCLAGINAK